MRRREIKTVLKNEGSEVRAVVFARFDQIPLPKRRWVTARVVGIWLLSARQPEDQRRPKPRFADDLEERIENYRAMGHDEVGPSGRVRARA